MSKARQRAAYQQLTQFFERDRVIGLREGGFFVKSRKQLDETCSPCTIVGSNGFGKTLLPDDRGSGLPGPLKKGEIDAFAGWP